MPTAPSTVKPVAHAPAVLHDIDWGTYIRIRRAFDLGGRLLRLTYDRGTLEIMGPPWELEQACYILARFVDVLTEELRLAYEPGGSVTLRRRRKRRGIEPNNCYWIASARQLEGKTNL